MREKVIIPYAPILMESTRFVGYTFQAALADIIDNSIGKYAKEIHVKFDSSAPQYLAVIDNGCGMDEEELEIAMRYGSKSTSEIRDERDLGRFGLGLKMSSLSQCRKLTVITKRDGKVCAARWDLDYVIKTCEWKLQIFDREEIDTFMFAEDLYQYKSGTIVIWEEFDRLAKEAMDPVAAFDENLELSFDHLALVFHRFLDPTSQKDNVNIYFNNNKVLPQDPFLIGHPATQPLTEQTFFVDDSEVKVKPYILPHLSKIRTKDIEKLGSLDDLRQNQGFYIYRNKRLIIWGTWFRLVKQHELNKLARIRVDIPNTLDSIWDIDIKKSQASLPRVIRKHLVSIVESTIGRSERVYKYRGRKIFDNELEHVWNLIDNRGILTYKINKEIALYKKLESSLSEENIKYLDSFLKMIEASFPYADVYYRYAKNEIHNENDKLSFEEVYQIGVDTINHLISINSNLNEIFDVIRNYDFFQSYPDVIKKLEENFYAK